MTLQAKILRYLNRQPKTWVIKIIKANQRGCPDILCCRDGQFVAIEVKEAGVVSPIQWIQLDLIAKAGGRKYVAYDFAEFKEWWNNGF